MLRSEVALKMLQGRKSILTLREPHISLMRQEKQVSHEVTITLLLIWNEEQIILSSFVDLETTGDVKMNICWDDLRITTRHQPVCCSNCHWSNISVKNTLSCAFTGFLANYFGGFIFPSLQIKKDKFSKIENFVCNAADRKQACGWTDHVISSRRHDKHERDTWNFRFIKLVYPINQINLIIALFVDFLSKINMFYWYILKTIRDKYSIEKQKCSEWWVLHTCQISYKLDYFWKSNGSLKSEFRSNFSVFRLWNFLSWKL